MRCASCTLPIRAGTEERKRVEFRTQSDGAVCVYGEFMPHGPLAAATGRLAKVLHQKCYWVEWKRENRGGDVVEGTRPGLLSEDDIYGDEDDD